MSLADDMAADFHTMWEEMRCTVSIGDGARPRKVKALVTSITTEAELDLGGFAPQKELTVRVLRSTLSSTRPPTVGGTLRFEREAYCITSLIGKPQLPILTITCQQK